MSFSVGALWKLRPLILLVLYVFGPSLFGQAVVLPTHTAQGPYGFGVVSIHELPLNQDTTGYGGGFFGGRYRAHAYSVAMLLSEVTGIRDPSRITSLPGWAVNRKYDLTATIDVAPGHSLDELNEVHRRALIWSILTSRFGVRAHLEMKPAASFALIVAQSISTPLSRSSNQSGPCVWRKRSPSYLQAESCSMADLADALNEVDDRPVTDRTNLSGRYDFSLSFNDAATTSLVNGVRFAANPDTPSDLPSLYKALPTQLGLRLRPSTTMLPAVSVDAVSLPSEN